MLLVNGLNNSPGYWKRQYSIALMQRNTDSSISSIFLPGWTCKKCCIRNRRFLETRRTHPSSSLISSRGSHTWLSVITCFSSFAPETLHGRKYIQCYKKLEEYTIWWTALTYIVWEFPLAHLWKLQWHPSCRQPLGLQVLILPLSQQEGETFLARRLFVSGRCLQVEQIKLAINEYTH